MAKRKPIQMGIVGLGRAGGIVSWGMHPKELESRRTKFNIAAVSDIIKSRRDDMAAAYGCKAYASLDAMLRDPNIELIDIATRSNDHLAHALLALKAGKDVFLEKPITTTYAEARRLQRAAERASGTLYIRHNRRFEPAFAHISEIIASGILGDVYEVKLHRHSYQRRDDWQTLKAFGGGQLLNWGPHIIDHALQFLDAPVADIWSDLKCIAAGGDAEDHLKIILKGTNERVVDLEISGGVAISQPEEIVFGSCGTLVCDGSGKLHLKYLDPKVKLKPRRSKKGTPGTRTGGGGPDPLKWIEKTIAVKPRSRCNLGSIWDHLYAAIREGKPFPITMEQSVAVMSVVSQARKGTAFNV